MKEYTFTTKFDAKLSQNILKVIGYLYEYNKRDVIQDLERECALCDVRLLEKNNAVEEEKGIFKQFFTKKLLVDLQYLVSTIVDVKSQQKTVQITFKGSQERIDWATNFAFTKSAFFDTELKVHKGFQRSIELFEESFREHCATEENTFFTRLYDTLQEKDTKIILTGHSLGGALATLAACRFYDLGIKPENLVVYSFGAPPVGSQKFIDAYQNKFSIYRFANTLDIVPLVDKLLFAFKQQQLLHIGKKIELASNEGEVHGLSGYIDNMSEFIDNDTTSH